MENGFIRDTLILEKKAYELLKAFKELKKIEQENKGYDSFLRLIKIDKSIKEIETQIIKKSWRDR